MEQIGTLKKRYIRIEKDGNGNPLRVYVLNPHFIPGYSKKENLFTPGRRVRSEVDIERYIRLTESRTGQPVEIIDENSELVRVLLSPEPDKSYLDSLKPQTSPI